MSVECQKCKVVNHGYYRRGSEYFFSECHHRMPVTIREMVIDRGFHPEHSNIKERAPMSTTIAQ